jgi:arabinose-5-phosphate isomerase
MKIKQVMITPDKFAQVNPSEFLKVALDKMNDSKLGIACVVENKSLTGIITDGDIRRKLLNVQKPLSALFSDYSIDHAITNPTTCKENETLRSAVELMEKKQIWDLPVINDNGDLVGLLHLHAAIKHLL